MGDVELLIVAGLVLVLFGVDIAFQIGNEEDNLKKAGIALVIGVLWIWALFYIC